MEYRRLGGSGVMVSELCLGCMTFGRESDESVSQRMVDVFIDAPAATAATSTAPRL